MGVPIVYPDVTPVAPHDAMNISRQPLKGIRRHFTVTLTSQVLTLLQGVLVMPLIIRLAGLSVYGGYLIWPSALSLLFAASYFGVGYSYRRRVASAGDLITRRALFLPQFSYQLTVLSLLCLIAASVSTAWPDYSHNPEFVPATVGIAWLAVHFLFFQTQEYFRNTLRFDYFNLINILSNLLGVASIAAWGLSGHKLTVAGLLILTTIAKALATFPWLVALLRELGVPKVQLPVKALWADIKAGWPLFLDFLCYTALTFGDRYLITLFLSITDVGRYQPGYQLASLLLFIPRCGDMILPPILARAVDSGALKTAEKMTSDFLHLFLTIGFPYAAGAVLVGPTIVAAIAGFETAYISRWVTGIVVIGALMYGVTLLYYQAAYVLGHMRLVAIANGLGALTNIVANVVLLSIFRNITVAAIACLVSYAVTVIYIIVVIRNSWKIALDWSRLFRCIVSTVLMAALLIFLGFRPLTVTQISLANLALAILAASALYLGIAWIFGDLKFSVKQQAEPAHKVI